jgi:hypothetical protein
MPKVIIRQTIPTGVDLEVNDVPQGTFAAGSTIDVNLTDGVNPVTPDSVTVVGNVVTAQVPACPDYDAELFITVTGITDATEQGAIRTLVSDLKTSGLWEKMHIIYPIIGGSATLHKYNLKNPQDSNGAFRLTFLGGWTHAATGMLPNGTTGYANTHYRPLLQTATDDFHCMINVRNINTGSSRFHCGAATTGPDNLTGLGRVSLGSRDIGCHGGQVTEYAPSATLTPFVGSKIINTIGSRSARYFQNGLFVANAVTQTRALVNADFTIGVLGGGLAFYDNCEYSFFTMGLGLTDSEALALHNAQLTFNTTLGR